MEKVLIWKWLRTRLVRMAEGNLAVAAMVGVEALLEVGLMAKEAVVTVRVAMEAVVDQMDEAGQVAAGMVKVVMVVAVLEGRGEMAVVVPKEKAEGEAAMVPVATATEEAAKLVE